MQRIAGLYRLTQVPKLYALLQGALGGTETRERIAADILRIPAGAKVLDVGCGSAAILAHLDHVNYMGVDANPDHIAEARAIYGERGTFVVGDVGALQSLNAVRFDVVVCIGVFHHIPDNTLRDLCVQAQRLLVDGGRLIAIDPVFVPRQNWIARGLAAADSGKCVRSSEGYRVIVAHVFGQAEVRIFHDLLRVPYTHCVTTAYKLSQARRCDIEA